MCGLFGWAGTPLKSVAILRAIAEHTEAYRGGHAHGWAWLDAAGTLRHHKAPGAIRDHADSLQMLVGAVAVIGHCRWATHGSVDDNINNHPHPSRGGWIVHNGIVHNHLGLADKFSLKLSSRCDSEVIGRMVEKFRGSLEDRLAEALSYVESNCAVLGLWASPKAMLFVGRAGNPLHYLKVPGGTYLASLAESLPGKSTAFEDWSVGSIEIKELSHVRQRKERPNVRRQPHGQRVSLAV